MSSGSDSDLPEVFTPGKVTLVQVGHICLYFPIIYFQGRESITETRTIREQQDMEYQESLRIDREKAEKAREERKRVEVCLP